MSVGNAQLRRPASVRLQAESIGCRVPVHGRRGRVEAVFDSAWLVAMDGGGLVAVLANHAGNVAHGVRLTAGAWSASAVRQAMPVRIDAQRMTIDGGAVVIELSDARSWRTGLRPGLCATNVSLAAAAALLCDALRDRAPRCGSSFLAAVLDQAAGDPALARRVAAILPRLAHAARMHDGETALDLVARLIGLGPGLTPAGDDFVVGWLAGLALSAARPAQAAFLRSLCAGIPPLASATTGVSRQHLEDACALEFSERLADLCLAIAAGAGSPLFARRVDTQLQVGATSGADAAAGLVFALRDCAAS